MNKSECHAILRVSYISDTKVALIETATESDMRNKIEDLRSKDQVVEIEVFPHHHDLVLTKTWETKMYTAPVEVPKAPAAAEPAKS